ncbi:MAG: hypothetical protein A2798_03145 [Candidatus Levybacteria bacterium RIFCSPHIGHO2_01_FULL_37_17]|nr:MAG: hypothetical protein A2798_03145 [Candidatus Levybacteria bacterium RIFCSPHIGHO2_01_FULL_37_17]OGH36851.1 MAG: hypothetical protein A2959_01135 [Candidatus Levybacteria bacterium RIFCSPLOWO2_01_FULL_38_23]
MAEAVEANQDPIEAKIVVKEQEVLREIQRVEELSEIQYVPGFEDRVGFFPSLEALPAKPVLARFSYGKNAGNMSAKFFDLGESEAVNSRNRLNFFNEQGFSENKVWIKGFFQGTEVQIEEVSLETLQDKEFVIGNLIFTRDPRIAMYILPADCPTVVIYAKDKDGHDLVAIDHCGADAENAGITRQGLWYLQDTLGVDLSTAVAAVFPGVSQENFYITNEPERRGNGIVERNWGPFITSKQTSDDSEKRYVDILSAFEMQAVQAGMKPENIQAYRRDTYEDAANGIAYSRRYSGEHNDAHLGGNLVAVQLKPKSA